MPSPSLEPFPDQPELCFRPTQANDAPAIRALLEAAYAIYVPRMGRLPVTMEGDFAAAVRDDLIWVVTDGAGLLAVLHLRLRPDHLFVEDVAVRPDRQRQGIGKRLLAFSEEEGRRRGHGEIRLFTNATMVENAGLYAGLGYREYHREPVRGTDVIYMRKAL
ncbi:MAG: GNAT family N-acetyltransferase [Rhodospirillales bacterium]|nr:GNAT family N-acetyltransferase [Rhodospirillales bacterium]